jgi:hypothetical protein
VHDDPAQADDPFVWPHFQQGYESGQTGTEPGNQILILIICLNTSQAKGCRASAFAGELFLLPTDRLCRIIAEATGMGRRQATLDLPSLAAIFFAPAALSAKSARL